jgi:hypothetical protein
MKLNIIVLIALGFLCFIILFMIFFGKDINGYCQKINENLEFNPQSYYDPTHISCCENEKKQITLEDGTWKEIYNKTCYAYEKINDTWVKK